MALLTACNEMSSNQTVPYQPDAPIQTQSFLDEETELAGLGERDCDDADEIDASQ
jgi:hypothetical protein